MLSLALARRHDLLTRLAAEGTDCYRLFHGLSEGRAGLSIDLYGRLLLVQTFREPLSSHELGTIADLARSRIRRDVLVVWNHRAGWPREPFERWHVPEPAALEEQVVTELGVRYAIRARHRGQDPWIFLDLRAGRRILAGLAPGKRVLNLFAYTGSAGVCAAAHGAGEVWNVDFARSSLDVARRHAALNALPPGVLREVCQDVLPVVRQLAGLPVKGRGASRAHQRFEPRSFDVVLLDPPAWSVGPFGAVDVERDYASLFKPALLATAPGGRVIATNHVARVGADAWRASLVRTAEKCGRPLAALAVVGPEADFPGDPPTLKIAVARLS
ncbi:MAG: class I SAM-dependent methyltransferase [Planctomycetes bacterium]|nr:class I SAM-dependent methyltransferase [Planctomycetota bacterium]